MLVAERCWHARGLAWADRALGVPGVRSGRTWGGRMQILVCGASGLIGPAVVRQLLDAGHSVTALDVSLNPAKLPPASDQLTLRRGDVTELVDVMAAAKLSGTQRIINLAFVLPPDSESDPRLGLRVN